MPLTSGTQCCSGQTPGRWGPAAAAPWPAGPRPSAAVAWTPAQASPCMRVDYRLGTAMPAQAVGSNTAEHAGRREISTLRRERQVSHSSSDCTVCNTNGFRSPEEDVGVTTSRRRTRSNISRPRSLRTVKYCVWQQEKHAAGSADRWADSHAGRLTAEEAYLGVRCHVCALIGYTHVSDHLL